MALVFTTASGTWTPAEAVLSWGQPVSVLVWIAIMVCGLSSTYRIGRTAQLRHYNVHGLRPGGGHDGY